MSHKIKTRIKIKIIFVKETGKTRTLVEAIFEIVRTTDKHVLVTASSNAACDEITEHLMQLLSPNEMFRLYAKTSDKTKISENIKPICNFKKDEFIFPSLEYLKQFRVVICTLLTSGCFTRARGFATKMLIQAILFATKIFVCKHILYASID